MHPSNLWHIIKAQARVFCCCCCCCCCLWGICTFTFLAYCWAPCATWTGPGRGERLCASLCLPGRRNYTITPLNTEAKDVSWALSGHHQRSGKGKIRQTGANGMKWPHGLNSKSKSMSKHTFRSSGPGGPLGPPAQHGKALSQKQHQRALGFCLSMT